MPLNVDSQWRLEGAYDRPSYFASLREMHDFVETLPRNAGRMNGTCLQWKKRPHLLVCHDFQGGYTESLCEQGYTFERWACTDIMIYFSHKRVSLPPPGWIRAAHTHGTHILGTLIFEWDQSKNDLRILLDGFSPTWHTPVRAKLSMSLADELIHLAAHYGVDGFLINVETSLDLTPFPNPILQQLDCFHNASRLRKWVKYLTDKGKERLPVWHVVWYDSVTYPSGQLQWQDAMTPSNAPFFRAAQLGFTNYTWAHPEKCTAQDVLHPCLARTAAVANTNELAHSQVFIGIDVFGRNCFGGHDAFRALDMIRHKNSTDTSPEFSVALFAPAWTWEHDAPPARSWDAWWAEDCTFWEDGSHAITRYFANRAFPWHGNATYGYGFRTNFCIGAGTRWFMQGRQVHTGAWTDQGVSAPKPTLAWPHVAYALNKRGEHSCEKVSTDLCMDDAWSGTCSLSVRSDTFAYVPLLAVQPVPSEAPRDIALRICIKGGAHIEPCICIRERMHYGTVHVQDTLHGWRVYTVQYDMPHDAHTHDIHVLLGIEGAARIGQVELSRATCKDAESDAIWHDGSLTWADCVPWAACYELCTVGDAPEWIGTVSGTLDRTLIRLQGGDAETIVQVHSVGAWLHEPTMLVMPS